MKIGLINICYIESFSENKYHKKSISFLKTNNIKYKDFTQKTETLEDIITNINKAIDSDCDILWCIRGGSECINILNHINRTKIGTKKIIGTSDFTHFTTIAVSKGIKCYYGEVITKLNFENKIQIEIFLNFLKTGEITNTNTKGLYKATKKINITKESLIGGHLAIFNFMQSHLNIDIRHKYLFIEYHSGEKDINMLLYYINQLKYIIRRNKPLGIILGNINLNGKAYSEGEINSYIINRIKTINIPIYYIDHISTILKLG